MIPTVHRKRVACRLCGNSRFPPFLSLGPTPLANSFLRSPDEFRDEPSYPLDVYFCETCSLVQLLDVIDPTVLFRNYIYVTGTSETIAEHNVRYARTLVDLLRLRTGDLVVEVASNDGSLLKCFREHGVRTLGVEPATNIAALARASGIETVNEFLDLSTAQAIRESHGSARVVIGNNVLAHVDDPVEFLRGCKALIEPDGLVVVEVPYLRELISKLEYDTIYHEHLCYFSVRTLTDLASAAGLSVIRMDHTPVHGGSLRMYAALSERHPAHSEDVLAMASAEESNGTSLADFECYERFARNVEQNRRDVRALLESLVEDGRIVAGYGAPAKGNTLLNYCGIDTQLIQYIVDKNPLKVGLYTPGTHIPVLPVATLTQRQPDDVMILAWNLADEIMGQQQQYRDRGGRFIVPIPVPKVV